MLKAKRLFDTLEPKTLIGQRARQKKIIILLSNYRWQNFELHDGISVW